GRVPGDFEIDLVYGAVPLLVATSSLACRLGGKRQARLLVATSIGPALARGSRLNDQPMRSQPRPHSATVARMEMSSPASPPEPSVTCLGAAQSVTGSMHLAEVAGRRVLLDCGLFLGNRFETRERNLDFPFDPTSLDAVVLSHAHLDHCGNVPNLVRQGFAGPIYCTPATRDLVDVMLTDSARIYEEDALLQSVLGPTNADGVPPLYSRADVAQTLAQCVPLPYEQPHDLFDGVRLRLRDAGHLLGSAVTV